MNILKFGGSSVQNAAGFIRCAQIIAAQTEPQIVILSATKDTTNQLEFLLEANPQQQPQLIEQIFQRHSQLIKELKLESASLKQKMEHYQTSLSAHLLNIHRASAINNQATIEVLSLGEYMSCAIMSAYLSQQVQSCQLLDSRQLLIADGDDFNALIDIEKSRLALKQLSPKVAPINIAVGFIAGSTHGQTKLLGRNGSDYSAAAYAAIFEADSCQIWTDVAGIYSADPNTINQAKVIEQLDYQEAMEMAQHGAKVLHPRTILPLALYKIPCLVKNTYSPKQKGSLIKSIAKEQNKIPVKSVSYAKDLALINISGAYLRDQKGSAAAIFAAIAKARVSVKLISQSSSEYSICFCIQQADVAAVLSALEHTFSSQLAQQLLNPIEVLSKRAIVSIVGNGLRHKKGIAAKFMYALSLADSNIEAIAQGSSERSISVVIKQNNALNACHQVHQEFFNRSQRIDLFIIGCGNVGSEFISQCFAQQKKLLTHNIELKINLVANSKAFIFNAEGLSQQNWQSQLEGQQKALDINELATLAKQHQLINPTIVDSSCSQQISACYQKFIELGFNLVTANKKANSGNLDYYQALKRASSQSLRQYHYETTVGAGLPVIRTLKNLLHAGDSLLSFSGILSGSLSYIVGELEKGQLFSKVVASAKQLGFTEPDPRDDLSGLDVARKLLIIARETGLEAELEAIQLEPLLPASFNSQGTVEQFLNNIEQLDKYYAKLFAEAKKKQQTLRYIAKLVNGKMLVGLQSVDIHSPLAPIAEGENAIALHSNYYSPKPLVLRGYGAGARVTAAGLFSDIINSLPHREQEIL